MLKSVKGIIKMILPATAFFTGTLAEGITLKSGKKQLNINAYLDLEYTNMTKMPMARPCSQDMPCTMHDAHNNPGNSMTLTDGHMLMDMPDTSIMDQNHLNLIFSGRYKNTMTLINLESRHSFSTFDGNNGSPGRQFVRGTSRGTGSDDNVGSFRIAEAYGEIGIFSLLTIRAGYFFSPFGLYNSIRYATPLFATVVLPYIYEMPANYSGTPIVPTNSNIMLYGTHPTRFVDVTYQIYSGQGVRFNNNSGRPADRGFGQEMTNLKTYGGRLLFSLNGGQYLVGASYFTYHPTVSTTNAMGMPEGKPLKKSSTAGLDFDIFLPAGFRLQSEYAVQNNPQGSSVLTDDVVKSYYFRVMYEDTVLMPFIMYDFLDNPHDPVYKSKGNRAGVGFSYEAAKQSLFKLEYHYHTFRDALHADGYMADGTKVTSSSDAKIQHMTRASLIFYL